MNDLAGQSSLSEIIEVKNVFRFFYFGNFFYVFNVFLFSKRFLF